MNQIGFGAGIACASMALHIMGTQADGLTAAAISFAVPINIIKVSEYLYNSGAGKKTNNQIGKEVVSAALSRLASGLLSYYAIRGLCPQLSIKRALIVTGLGVVGLGLNKLPIIFKNKAMFVTEEITAGVILTAASGLKALGYIK